jgi:cytochrome c biogenesis factor
MAAFVTADLIKVVIACLLLHYVRRMETIKCLDYNSWKPTFIKLYAVLTLILVTISLFSTQVGLACECNLICAIVSTILGVTLVYAVYTHIRELENNFYQCQLNQQDENVHEFLKLYSLLMVISLIFVAIMIISTVIATTLPIPKYIAMQHNVNTQVANNKATFSDARRKCEKRLVSKVADEVQRRKSSSSPTNSKGKKDNSKSKSKSKGKSSSKSSSKKSKKSKQAKKAKK